MYHPTTRVLTVLELLQAHSEMSGAELARRLEVEPRTVRRYITMLRDMGIPVEGERGRHGTYFLRPGYKLPPLMFTGEEALAVALGLRLARQVGFSSLFTAVEGALAKLERVMPSDVASQITGIESVLDMDLALPRAPSVIDGVLATALMAVRTTRQVRLRYVTQTEKPSERVVDFYKVAFRVGRWYAVGYCHLRQDIRVFRLDRILEIDLLETTFIIPTAFDALPYIEQTMARTPGIYRVEVLFEAPPEEVQPHIPKALGVLTPHPDGTTLLCYVQSLEWVAGYIVGVPHRATIIAPDELRAALRGVIDRANYLLNGSSRLPKANETFTIA